VSLNRFAKRRDANDLEIKRLAERLGWFLTALDVPCDYLGLFRGRWQPIEIKRPAGPRGGLTDRKLTSSQKSWHAAVATRGAKVLVWRTVEDVVRDSR
jgi:hypothetical protein